MSYSTLKSFGGVSFAACAVFFAGQASGAVTEIGTGIVNPANGHTYHLLGIDDQSSSLMELEDYAVAQLGGHLVSINDALENAFVHDTFAPLANGADDSWLIIGVHDLDLDGNYENFSGEPVPPIFWGLGEPNFPGSEPFVALVDSASTSTFGYLDGFWADFPDIPNPPVGFAPVYGVVEVVPTPGTAALLGVAGLVTVRRRR